MFNILRFVVMQSRTTVIHSYLKTLVFISYYSTCSFFVPSFIYLSFILCHIFISERDCTPLQCLHKGWKQSNQQLAQSRLMHNIHCGSAIFPYQALERRTAQETLNSLGCAGLHNKKYEGTEHSLRTASTV
jgi:hypothetical protein